MVERNHHGLPSGFKDSWKWKRRRMMSLLHSAFMRTILVSGNFPTFMVRNQKDPAGTSRQLITGKRQHVFLDDVADHLTQRDPKTTNSDGKHESTLGYVFANTAALRAVRKEI